jgi:hypothetical protein
MLIARFDRTVEQNLDSYERLQEHLQQRVGPQKSYEVFGLLRLATYE